MTGFHRHRIWTDGLWRFFGVTTLLSLLAAAHVSLDISLDYAVILTLFASCEECNSQ